MASHSICNGNERVVETGNFSEQTDIHSHEPVAFLLLLSIYIYQQRPHSYMNIWKEKKKILYWTQKPGSREALNRTSLRQ